MAKITMRQAISQALWEEMEKDPKVFIMGEDVGLNWGGANMSVIRKNSNF